MPPDLLTRKLEAPPREIPAPPVAPEPQSEYVAGGMGFVWSYQYYHSLPHDIDDVSRDFGDDIYERMLLDPQIASCIHLLKMAVLAKTPALTSAVTDDEDTDHANAQKALDLCQSNYDGLANKLLPALYNLLDGIALGYKVAEVTWELRPDHEGKKKLLVKSVKVKPRSATAFVMDPWMNLTGLLAIIPGQYPFLIGGTLVGDLDTWPNLLSPRKFMIFTHRKTDEDPRGQAALRPAYGVWYVKLGVWPELQKYVTQFASPSLIGELAPGAKPEPAINADGSPVIDDATGVQVVLNPAAQMGNSIAGFKNGTWIVIPNGAKITALEVKGNGEAFQTLIELCDRQMAKAILMQTLATEQATHQARAASQTHQDILGLVIGYIRGLLEALLAQMNEQVVEYNMGPSFVRLTPTVSLAETEQQDFAAYANAVANLMRGGYFVDEQLPEVDALLNLPVRSEEAMAAAAQAEQEAAQAKVAALQQRAPGQNGASVGAEQNGGPAPAAGNGKEPVGATAP